MKQYILTVGSLEKHGKSEQNKTRHTNNSPKSHRFPYHQYHGVFWSLQDFFYIRNKCRTFVRPNLLHFGGPPLREKKNPTKL